MMNNMMMGGGGCDMHLGFQNLRSRDKPRWVLGGGLKGFRLSASLPPTKTERFLAQELAVARNAWNLAPLPCHVAAICANLR